MILESLFWLWYRLLSIELVSWVIRVNMESFELILGLFNWTSVHKGLIIAHVIVPRGQSWESKAVGRARPPLVVMLPKIWLNGSTIIIRKQRSVIVIFHHSILQGRLLLRGCERGITHLMIWRGLMLRSLRRRLIVLSDKIHQDTWKTFRTTCWMTWLWRWNLD